MVDRGITLLERYQRLIEITLHVSSTLDLNTLLDHIAHDAADLSDSEAASILLYEEATKQLHFEVTTNLDEPMMRGLVVPVENSIAGWIVTHQEPVMVTNAHKDPRHFGIIEKTVELETTSLLGVPVTTKNKVVGVLEVINKKHGMFNDEDQRLLGAMGAIAAVAIENTRLFQQSDMISEMVHELRTPLSSINTATHLLLRPEINEEQRKKTIGIIQDESSRLTQLTTSYLDLARLESGRAQFFPEIVDIQEILASCEAIMRPRSIEKGLRFEKDIAGQLPPIKIDPAKIKQVLLNLLSNAIKYNCPGGSILLSGKTDGKEILISVKDTGPGIPADYIPHLGEKFYRAPGTEHLAGGTGLGLSITRHIVEAHKGWLEVQSEVGAGSTFIVHLPLPYKRKK
ncbi:MAG: ATP-binding protein [Omnitrophica WOR_2 bacterium]